MSSSIFSDLFLLLDYITILYNSVLYKYVYIQQLHNYTMASVLQKHHVKKSTTYSHMPRLDTVQMVENMLAKEKEFSSKNKLWRALPKQVQYKTFTTILDYLEKSNKIIYDKDGSILWIFMDNKKLEKLLKSSTKLR